MERMQKGWKGWKPVRQEGYQVGRMFGKKARRQDDMKASEKAEGIEAKQECRMAVRKGRSGCLEGKQ